MSLALGAGAQGNSSSQANVDTPILGFAFDAGARALRLLRGVPGAAVAGETLDPGFALAAATVSPRQDFALAVSQGDGRVRLLRFQGAATPAVSLLDQAMAFPDRMILSPAGRAALLWRRDSGRLQAVTGLPDNPSVQELAAGLDAAFTGMAIADDSAVVLSAAAPDEALSWLLLPGGNSLPLPASGVAAAFRPDSRDLVVAAADGRVYLVRDTGYSEIHPADDRTAGPVAVRFSPDGSRIYIATAAGRLSAVDPSAGSFTSVSCACVPTGLESLAAGTLFRLGDISNLPLWLFDASPRAPRVWFVPPPSKPAAPQGGAQ